jgi:hypothetical protein
VPSGRWLALRSEYGESAWWIAVAEAPQEFEPLEVVGHTTEGPEKVLSRLANEATIRPVASAIIAGVARPRPAGASKSLAAALNNVTAALPHGWWMSGLEGSPA